MCARDDYSWTGTGQNFQSYGQAITCSGEATLVASVGITTYAGSDACQGGWEVYCDGISVGAINTLGKTCTGSAMTNGCDVSFSPRTCANIRIEAIDVGSTPGSCCGGSGPDSMITAVSAW